MALSSDLKCGVRKEATNGSVIYVITLADGENRFYPESIERINKALDSIEGDCRGLDPTTKSGLIITGENKYFSVGLDLQSFYKGDPENVQKYFERTYCRLIARIVTWPMITIAAINGHAIAGGLVLALACDYRVMGGAGQRGWLAMNEIQLPSSIPTGMLAILQAKLGGRPDVLRECLLQGHRFNSQEAKDDGWIDLLADSPKAVLESALMLAKEKGHVAKKGPFVQVIKQSMYRDALKILLGHEQLDHFKFAMSINKI